MPDLPTSMSVSPLTARKTWRTVEPLHGMIYFAPESGQSYARLGLEGTAGYFASRSAAMGAVGAETVIATFYNFNPDLVRAAIPSAWAASSPAAILEARLEAADAALRRMLGDAVTSEEMSRAAGLARRAAERAAERYEGRPLFAAHAGLPWPEQPHLVLWHAQTLLREFRGDGHITVLLQSDLDPVEALVLHLASGELPGNFLRASRAWPEDDWEAGVWRLADRGLVQRSEPTDGAPAEAVLTEQGTALRMEMEDATDRLAVHPYEAIGEDGCDELRALARPFSRAVVDGAGLQP
jgi:hypothetical protein